MINVIWTIRHKYRILKSGVLKIKGKFYISFLILLNFLIQGQINALS